MVAFLQSLRRRLSSLAVRFLTYDIDLINNHLKIVFEFEIFSPFCNLVFLARQWRYHPGNRTQEHKSVLTAGSNPLFELGKFSILDEERPIFLRSFPVLFAANLINLYFFNILPLTILLMLALLFLRSRVDARISSDTTWAKSKFFFMSFEVVEGLRPPSFNMLETNFRGVRFRALSFTLLFFIRQTFCRSEALLFYRTSFSCSNLASFFLNLSSLRRFLFLADSPLFGKAMATSNGEDSEDVEDTGELTDAVMILLLSSMSLFSSFRCFVTLIRTASLRFFSSLSERSFTLV